MFKDGLGNSALVVDLVLGSAVGAFENREIAWPSTPVSTVGCGAAEPVNFLIAPVGVSSLVEVMTEPNGTGLRVNRPNPAVDACRWIDREFLLDGEIRDVDRRREETDGFGNGVDAQNPVD
jgi:hypothetical protein